MTTDYTYGDGKTSDSANFVSAAFSVCLLFLSFSLGSIQTKLGNAPPKCRQIQRKIGVSYSYTPFAPSLTSGTTGMIGTQELR